MLENGIRSPLIDRSVQHETEITYEAPVEAAKFAPALKGDELVVQIGRIEGPSHRASVANLADEAKDKATARRRFDATLESLERATTDPLTGLRTRSGLAEDLPRIIEHARHTDKRYLIGVLDLDGVKEVNDTLATHNANDQGAEVDDTEGHQLGDAYIKTAANAIRSTFHPGDNAYRIGGDEFVVLLEDDGEELYDVLKSRLSENLANDVAASVPLQAAARERGLTYGGSFGMSEWDPTTTSFDDAFSVADQSMYLDKASNHAAAEEIAAA